MKMWLLFPSSDILDSKSFKSTIPSEKQGQKKAFVHLEWCLLLDSLGFSLAMPQAEVGLQGIVRGAAQRPSYVQNEPPPPLSRTRVRGFKNRWWNMNGRWYSHCGKQCGGSSKKPELPYDPVITLGTNPKNTKTLFKKTYAPLCL